MPWLSVPLKQALQLPPIICTMSIFPADPASRPASLQMLISGSQPHTPASSIFLCLHFLQLNSFLRTLPAFLQLAHSAQSSFSLSRILPDSSPSYSLMWMIQSGSALPSHPLSQVTMMMFGRLYPHITRRWDKKTITSLGCILLPSSINFK